MTNTEHQETLPPELASHLSVTARLAGSVLVVKVVGFVLGFAVNFLLAKYYGAEILGQYALALGTLLLLSTLSSFGFDAGLMKFLPVFGAKQQLQNQHYLTLVALRTGFLFSSVLAVLLFVTSRFLANSIFEDPALSSTLKWGAIALIPITLSKILGGVYKAQKQSDLFSFYEELFQKILLAVVVTLLALMNWKAAWIVMAAFLATKTWVTLLQVRKMPLKQFDFSNFVQVLLLGSSKEKDTELRQTSFALRKFSASMLLITGVFIVLSKTDIVMIGYYRESADVGVYRIAMTIASLITFLQAAVNGIFPPIASELFAEKKMEELSAIYSATTKWIITLALPATLTVCFFPQPLLLVFGEEFESGALCLMILTLGYFITVSVGPIGFLLRMAECERTILIDSIALGVLNILLNFLLIPKYGIAGAAAATATALALFNLTMVVQAKCLLGIQPFRKTFFLFTIPLGVMAFTCYLFAHRIDSIVEVVLASIFNMLVALMCAILFRDSMDDHIYQKVKAKLRTLKKA